MAIKAKPHKVLVRGKLYNPTHFFNRDLSWLDFNSRVLHEAQDFRTPLLERLRFLDIFRSNNDEFFMKRTGSLMQTYGANSHYSIDGYTKKELLQAIRLKVEGQLKQFARTFDVLIKNSLAKEKIALVTWSDLSNLEKKRLNVYFKKNIYPILTPLAVDKGHPFPFLSNLSKSIGLFLRQPNRKEKYFARVKIPGEIDQWIALKSNKLFQFRFINIEEIITSNLSLLFPGMIIEGNTIFRITRNASYDEEGDDTDDIMDIVETGLKERKFAPIVRLEYQKNYHPEVLQFLQEELHIKSDSLYEMPCLCSYSPLSEICKINLPNLKYKRFSSKAPIIIDDEKGPNIFEQIKKRDIFVHFPFDKFSNTVERFLKEAAHDPSVKAIKIILYRTDPDGRIIQSLIEAAENKKQVACIIELKARFDEERNIYWAQTLEEAGVHVTYGLMDYKTHAKMIIVVRNEKEGLRSYVNIGTGNYNSQTSKLYTDFSYFTAKKTITEEVLEVFNFLTGRALAQNYKKLLVAPFNMSKRFISMIKREIEHKKKGKNGLIVAKMNSLEDPEIIQALYKASQAGVKIFLIVRGFCCLRPGVKGLSDNIRVMSLIGRLLEHSRLYYFSCGSKDPLMGEYYLGSADWMNRNLHDRVEVIAPLTLKEQKQMLWDYLNLLLADNRHVWDLNGQGVYTQRSPKKGKVINAQAELLGIQK